MRLHVLGFLKINSFFLGFMVFLTMDSAAATGWMPGYNYRKKISIHKLQVAGAVDLQDFPVLIVLNSPDLVYVPGMCSGNKLSGASGTDISFSMSSAPDIPLSFQLDSYQSAIGQLICWVRIPLLSAAGSGTGGNEIYFYYGSNTIHHPYGISGLRTWSAQYLNVWHMNPDDLQQRITHSSGIGQDNFMDAKIGKGVQLSGMSWLQGGTDTTTTFTLSAWIKLQQTGTEQMIMACDSVSAGGGYRLKVNAGGHVVLETLNQSQVHSVVGLHIITPGIWFYVAAVSRTTTKRVFVNGDLSGAGSSIGVKMEPGSAISIGRSKQKDKYFSGMVDELRTEHTDRTAEWLKTSYNNQLDPPAFYTVAAEEINPVQIVIAAVFNGNFNETWANAANWDAETLPEEAANVIVQAGKTLVIPANLNIHIGHLLLENAAHLYIRGQLQVSCTVRNNGFIHVQRIVDGPFPEPASARGWRLLSSPVYHLATGFPQYNLQAIKNSIFVTGAGGTANGFDPSPNNGATIYTHDQSIKGTLSQKYKAVPNPSALIPVGKGFYVFSRGSRDVDNAYASQITNPPFSNPETYLLTYTGELYTDGLTVALSNSNYGEEGDGFNLLGNPYASDISWADIKTVNTGPYIWLFDPLNNAYTVSDDPLTVIPSGSGFFLRVVQGKTTGSATFTQATALSTSSAVPGKKINVFSTGSSYMPNVQKANRLTVKVSRSVFAQEYTVIFKEGAREEINDDDALKIGEGFVSIASLSGQARLSIEERPPLKKREEIKLSVKGWSTGNYLLDLRGMESFSEGSSLVLSDKYLKINKSIERTGSTYPFTIDVGLAGSQGDDRFSLIFMPEEEAPVVSEEAGIVKDNLLVYPNPFTNVIHLISRIYLAPAKIMVRDLMGKVLWVKTAGALIDGGILDFYCGELDSGMYVLELRDQQTNKMVKSFKMIKE